MTDELSALRAQAQAQNAEYPQYDHYWDGWGIGVITKRVRTKMGIAFEPGDRVLLSPETREERVIPRGRNSRLPYDQWPVKTFATAYSTRNKINTTFLATSVRAES